MAIPFFSASIITGCVLNNIEVRARLENVLVSWGQGGMEECLAGNVWAGHLPLLFSMSYGTNMTGRRVAEKSRWWDQADMFSG